MTASTSDCGLPAAASMALDIEYLAVRPAQLYSDLECHLHFRQRSWSFCQGDTSLGYIRVTRTCSTSHPRKLHKTNHDEVPICVVFSRCYSRIDFYQMDGNCVTLGQCYHEVEVWSAMISNKPSLLRIRHSHRGEQ
jgi:hypothetical protein